MIRINDVVEELGDDVFIRQSKSMDNNELSIEQLQAISGGGVFAKLDGFKADRISPLSDGGKKTDFMAERTRAWLAPPWKRVKAVTQAKAIFG